MHVYIVRVRFIRRGKQCVIKSTNAFSGVGGMKQDAALIELKEKKNSSLVKTPILFFSFVVPPDIKSLVSRFRKYIKLILILCHTN